MEPLLLGLAKPQQFRTICSVAAHMQTVSDSHLPTKAPAACKRPLHARRKHLAGLWESASLTSTAANSRRRQDGIFNSEGRFECRLYTRSKPGSDRPGHAAAALHTRRKLLTDYIQTACPRITIRNNVMPSCSSPELQVKCQIICAVAYQHHLLPPVPHHVPQLLSGR